MKKITLFILTITLFMSGATPILQGAPIKNYPKMLTQPDGTQVKVLISGDEYYHWVTDTLGYTLLKNKQGWIVYANLVNDELVLTEYNAYSIDPQTIGLNPNLNISSEKYVQKRNSMLQQVPQQS